MTESASQKNTGNRPVEKKQENPTSKEPQQEEEINDVVEVDERGNKLIKVKQIPSTNVWDRKQLGRYGL